MKLSIMQAVVATVNEEWASSLADALLSHWEHDAMSFPDKCTTIKFVTTCATIITYHQVRPIVILRVTMDRSNAVILPDAPDHRRNDKCVSPM